LSTTSGPLAGGWVDTARVDAAGVEAAGRGDVTVGVRAGSDVEVAELGARDALDVTGEEAALDDRRGGGDEQAANAMTATAAPSMASRVRRRTPQRRTLRYPDRVDAGGYADRAGSARSSSAGQRGAADDKE
jgi:hypothetical protein